MSLRMSLARKAAISVAGAGLLVLLTAGQAQAATGTGNFTGGYEIPSEKVTLASGPDCARFHRINDNPHPDVDDPTIHVLPMSGTFGEPGNDTGTATFTINDDWFAGPNGTYTSITCSTATAVQGTLHIEFDDWSCEDDETALYQRTNQTTYTLTGTVVCDDLDTQTVETTPITITFTGTQVLCGGPSPQPTCNNVNAGTNLAGSYSWSTP